MLNIRHKIVDVIGTSDNNIISYLEDNELFLDSFYEHRTITVVENLSIIYDKNSFIIYDLNEQKIMYDDLLFFETAYIIASRIIKNPDAVSTNIDSVLDSEYLYRKYINDIIILHNNIDKYIQDKNFNKANIEECMMSENHYRLLKLKNSIKNMYNDEKRN